MTGWLRRRREVRDGAPVPAPRLEEARAAIRAAEQSQEDARRRWLRVTPLAGGLTREVVQNHITERVRAGFRGA
jgi:hypothetical protein